MSLLCLALTQIVFLRFWDHGVVCNSSSFIHISSPICPVVKNLPVNEGDARDEGLIPESGRFPGVINGNLLQYFFPGTFHGQRSLVGSTKSWTWLSMCVHARTHTHTHTPLFAGWSQPRCLHLCLTQSADLAGLTQCHLLRRALLHLCRY